MHPISEGTASSWSAGGSVDFTAPPSSGGVAAGENGNKTKQSWGWKNEKADFFFFLGWESRTAWELLPLEVRELPSWDLPFPGFLSAQKVKIHGKAAPPGSK